MATSNETLTDTQGPSDAAERRIAVENPATGKVIGHVPDLSGEDVARLARLLTRLGHFLYGRGRR
jgi:acyl-CoA reductase-like NAD-dependent aldehyde dehydrogenase